MAEIVIAQVRKGGASHDPVEQLAQGVGVEEPAGGVEKHPVVGSVGKPVVAEPAAPALKHLHCVGVDVDAASARSGLDTELDGLAPHVLQRP